jgi:hemoglobin
VSPDPETESTAAPEPLGTEPAASPDDSASAEPSPYARRASNAEGITLYEAAGGMPFFEALVDHFYAGVASDPALLRVYPDPEDLSGARHRLTLFLAQYWGGPMTYTQERGHPRLYMRHVPFPVGAAERDAWLRHMRAAVAHLDPHPVVAVRLLEYFDRAAEAMRNRD